MADKKPWQYAIDIEADEDEDVLDKALSIAKEDFSTSLSGIVAKEILCDTGAREYDCLHALEIYKEADETGRAIINSLLIDLCGWGMGNLLLKFLDANK